MYSSSLKLNEVIELEKDKSINLTKTQKAIYEAIKGLANNEAICQLEVAKLDILLNAGLVKIDGKVGVIDKT